MELPIGETRAFDCPSCGAPFAVPVEESIQCPACGESFRPKPVGPRPPIPPSAASVERSARARFQMLVFGAGSVLLALGFAAWWGSMSAGERATVPDAMRVGAMVGFGLVGMVAALILYFLPYVVATRRNHRQDSAIFIANLIFGWTFIGWGVCLVWAFMRSGQDSPSEAQQG